MNDRDFGRAVAVWQENQLNKYLDSQCEDDDIAEYIEENMDDAVMESLNGGSGVIFEAIENTPHHSKFDDEALKAIKRIAADNGDKEALLALGAVFYSWVTEYIEREETPRLRQEAINNREEF
jgi:hypothetical protein